MTLSIWPYLTVIRGLFNDFRGHPEWRAYKSGFLLQRVGYLTRDTKICQANVAPFRQQHIGSCKETTTQHARRYRHATGNQDAHRMWTSWMKVQLKRRNLCCCCKSRFWSISRWASCRRFSANNWFSFLPLHDQRRGHFSGLMVGPAFVCWWKFKTLEAFLYLTSHQHVCQNQWIWIWSPHHSQLSFRFQLTSFRTNLFRMKEWPWPTCRCWGESWFWQTVEGCLEETPWPERSLTLLSLCVAFGRNLDWENMWNLFLKKEKQLFHWWKCKDTIQKMT